MKLCAQGKLCKAQESIHFKFYVLHGVLKAQDKAKRARDESVLIYLIKTFEGPEGQVGRCPGQGTSSVPKKAMVHSVCCCSVFRDVVFFSSGKGQTTWFGCPQEAVASTEGKYEDSRDFLRQSSSSSTSFPDGYK